MKDKFLFFEDLKGINGKIAQTNAFEHLEELLDGELECEECDEKDFEIKSLEKDAENYENRISELKTEIAFLEMKLAESEEVNNLELVK